ncbi:MAG: rhodanese-like domain-containing protein [bacterium]
MKNYFTIITILLFACITVLSQPQNVKDLTCDESLKLIQENKNNPDFVILDVRTKEMYMEVHIANAVQCDVLSKEFNDWSNKADKYKTYLVYCNVGQRSGAAVEKMKKLNFKSIYHLYEGIRVWKEKGFPTVKGISDLEQVKKAINNVFGWAVNKDFDLFFKTISADSNFVSVTPYARVKFGIDAVKKDTSFWGSLDFKAIRHEIRDLRINFSKEGSVAWFYCVLDDINTWKGEPANWEKVRWTGVIEKREGKWRVVQQHFSWPKDS